MPFEEQPAAPGFELPGVFTQPRQTLLRAAENYRRSAFEIAQPPRPFEMLRLGAASAVAAAE